MKIIKSFGLVCSHEEFKMSLSIYEEYKVRHF